MREVYRITAWLPGGSTFGSTFDGKNDSRQSDRPQRWEFVGVVAEEAVRKRYLNGYVGRYFSQGAQNPISYVNLDS